jgi:tetratricopeptide (TPR) repeat protein
MPRRKSTHVDDPIAVGARLRGAREAAGMSQRELAFAGCTAAYISRIESGARIPSLQLLVELGRRVGVSADFLARGAEAERAESVLDGAEIAWRLDDYVEARRLYERALEGTSDDRGRSVALEGIGQVALREGQPDRAVAAFESALEISREDLCSRPSLAESLARAHASLGQYASAVAVLERCLAAYETGDDTALFIRFACLLGYALTDNGEFGRAEQVVAKAINAAREVADPYTRARVYWSQSRLLAEKGQVAAAEEYARRTLELLRSTEDTYAVAHAQQTLAHICLELGRPGEALSLLDEGWPLISTAGSRTEIARYRIDQARALAALGESEQAAAIAMELTHQLGDTHVCDAARAYQLIAEIWERLDEPERAQELYELAIEGLETHPSSRYLVAAYRQLAGLLKQQGRTDDALGLLEKAVAVQEAAGLPLR